MRTSVASSIRPTEFFEVCYVILIYPWRTDDNQCMGALGLGGLKRIRQEGVLATFDQYLHHPALRAA